MKLFKKVLIYTFILITIVIPAYAQEFQHFGFQQYDSRSIGLGLTGIVDAYGPLSVLRNPALNRSGNTFTLKPLFQWIGNNKWDDVIEIPSRLGSRVTDSTFALLQDEFGTTSRYYGVVVQGKGLTFGYIHSKRDELSFKKGVSLFDPQSKYFGRNVRTDLIYASYTLSIQDKGRLGVLLKNIQFKDTGKDADLREISSALIQDTDDIDAFLDDNGAIKESAASIDLGALYALNILRRPITVGVSINNIVGDEFRGVSPPMILNAGLAFVPFRGLLLEVNFVDLLEEEIHSNFSETGIRIGVEYNFSSLQIRSGLIGDNVSFGVGLGSEQLSLDYGVVEVDHNHLTKGRVKETYQAIQVSLNTRFF